MAHQNEDLIRRAYDAFGRGDIETIGQLFAADIAFHVSGRSTLAGDYVGKNQVFGVFARLGEITDNTFRTDVYDVLASDEHAVALQHQRAEREGKRPLDDRHVSVFRIKDGKIAEIWHHPGDLYAYDEFFS
jgi:uncharacterized protein